MADQQPMTAAERIKAALDAREAEHRARYGADQNLRGYKGPDREVAWVELAAGDLAEVAGGVADPDPDITAVLHNAAKGEKPDRKLTIMADHAYHLLDKSPGHKTRGKKHEPES